MAFSTSSSLLPPCPPRPLQSASIPLASKSMPRRNAERAQLVSAVQNVGGASSVCIDITSIMLSAGSNYAAIARSLVVPVSNEGVVQSAQTCVLRCHSGCQLANDLVQGSLTTGQGNRFVFLLHSYLISIHLTSVLALC
jgi:hypothetical protein